ADHVWLLERLRGLPAAVDVPPGLRLAERLAPLSGGKLVGRTLGPNRLLAVVAGRGLCTAYAPGGTEAGRRGAGDGARAPSGLGRGPARSSGGGACPPPPPTPPVASTGATRSSATGSPPGSRWSSRPAGT